MAYAHIRLVSLWSWPGPHKPFGAMGPRAKTCRSCRYPVEEGAGNPTGAGGFRLAHCGSEGHERKLCNLEALQSERDTDDRAAEEQAVQCCGQRQRDAAQDEPQEVREKGDGPASVFDFFSEGKEGQGGELEALLPDGDAYDCNAP